MQTLKIIISLAFLLVSLPTSACVCAHVSLVNRIASADFVALIHIDGIETDTDNPSYHLLSVRTQKIYKGDSLSSIHVRSSLNTSCAFLPETGSTWLVFATHHDDRLAFGYCDGNVNITTDKWPGSPESNNRHVESYTRTLNILDYITKENIELKNKYELGLDVYFPKEGAGKGIADDRYDYSLYELHVNAAMETTSFRVLKSFNNEELSRQIEDALKDYPKLYRDKLETLPEAVTVHVAFYFFPAKNGKDSSLTIYGY